MHMSWAGDLGARNMEFFKGAGALFSDVSGARAGAGATKNFGSFSSYIIIEKNVAVVL